MCIQFCGFRKTSSSGRLICNVNLSRQKSIKVLRKVINWLAVIFITGISSQAKNT